MTKKALVLIANGTEEIECVGTVDTLRRGEIEVTLAGVVDEHAVAPEHRIFTCSRGVKVVADTLLDDIPTLASFDLIVIPGGLGGAKTMAASTLVHKALKELDSEHRHIGAICAGPTVLAAAGVAHGKNITSHPSVKDNLVQAGYYYKEERVVVDGHIVTSRGPGTTLEFALRLVALLRGEDIAHKVAAPMIVH